MFCYKMVQWWCEIILLFIYDFSFCDAATENLFVLNNYNIFILSYSNNIRFININYG